MLIADNIQYMLTLPNILSAYMVFIIEQQHC